MIEAKMQKMAIFQSFSRTFLENSALAKVMNTFTISGGDLIAHPKAKSGIGMRIVNGTFEPVRNTIRNDIRVALHLTHKIDQIIVFFQIAAQKGSYLLDFKKIPQGALSSRGEGCFNTSRYNHSGIFAPLRVEQAAAQFPGQARFYRREKQPSDAR